MVSSYDYQTCHDACRHEQIIVKISILREDEHIDYLVVRMDAQVLRLAKCSSNVPFFFNMTLLFQGDRLLSTRIFHCFQVLARRCGAVSGCKYFFSLYRSDVNL